MSWGIKYRINYIRDSGGLTTIDILKKSYSATIYELTADGNPLVIDFSGSADNIFPPSIGTGATISFLATPLTMTEFFTNDPQLFIVNIYDGVSGSTLKWQGFVSSEIYNENYSYSTDLNVPITIQCNDGMQTLENILYLQSDGSYYTGNATLATIFGNILSKLGITFNNIYTSTDLIVKYGSPDITNIFLYLSLPQENFIDEQGIAMTCREVLENIISGLGDALSIRFFGSNIYIYNPICLNDTTKGKSYNASTFGSETTSAFGGYLDITNNDIKWYKTDSILDSVPIKGNVSIKYNPYTFTDYTYDFNNSLNWTTVGTWGGSSGFYSNNTVVYSGWNVYSGIAAEIGVKENLTDNPVYMLAMNSSGYKNNYTIPLSNITQDSGLSLRLTMDVFVQTKVNSSNIFSGATAKEINQLLLPFTLDVNSYYFKQVGWYTGFSGAYLWQMMIVRQAGITQAQFTADPTKSKVNDQWTTCSALIPLAQDTLSNPAITGNITLWLYDMWHGGDCWWSQSVWPNTPSNIYWVFLKNIKIEFVDNTTGLIVENTGVEHKGIVSTNLLLKSVFEIDTNCGVGKYGVSRGSFKTDQQTIPNINIAGVGITGNSPNYIDTADLMLLNILGQYELSRSKLSGVLNVAGIDYALKLIKDTTYLGAKAFYIISSSYNDREESASVEMVEITSTRETKL